MAMIECPQCASPISDKALKCPQCGAELEPVQEEAVEEKVVCEECGEEIGEGVESCPKCGCPVKAPEPELAQKVDVSNVSIKVSQGSRKKIIIAVVAVVVVILAGIAIKVGMDMNAQKQAEQAAADYKSTLNSAATSMLAGAAAAETAGGMIHDVWYNTINKKSDSKTDPYTKQSSYSSRFNDDFNTSLSNYMSSSSYKALKTTITDNQNEVKEYMKKLQNPPDGCAEAYSAIKDLYDAYNEIVNCAINPSGSLTSYTSTFNSADTAFSNKYDAVKLYL